MIGTQGRQLDTIPVAEFPAAAMAGISGSFAIDHWQISLQRGCAAGWVGGAMLSPALGFCFPGFWRYHPHILACVHVLQLWTLILFGLFLDLVQEHYPEKNTHEPHT